MRNLFCVALLLFCGNCLAQVSLRFTSDTVVYGTPGEDLYIQGMLINNGNAPVYVDAIRRQNNLPGDWLSSICLDVCYSPFTDSARVYLPANDSILYEFTFYSDSVMGTGSALIDIRNVSDPTSRIRHQMIGTTDTAFSLGINPSAGTFSVNIYPNPLSTTSVLTIEGCDSRSADITLYSLNGQKIKSSTIYLQRGSNRIEISSTIGSVSAGAYLLEVMINHEKKIVRVIAE
jgi:hypothetical protein